MKTSEIKELTTAEVTEKLANGKEELVRMCLNHSVNPLDNPMKIRYARKNIARLNTEIRKRQIENK
ncbi:MAG: 50S ribosomal protein L29 [Bacteroidetes bacterium]|nr:50S ribosomal protein L29 [Bacteroidota bacterium]MCL6101293.1 50S ribosomal protein L29 [Bacteroidota bacterium]